VTVSVISEDGNSEDRDSGGGDGIKDGGGHGEAARATSAGPSPGPSSVDWDQLLAQLATQPDDEGWVTLDEACRASGVSRSTLRSWYRKGVVPSRMVASLHGPQRVVPLEGVLERSAASPRLRRQLDHAHSLQSQIDDLRHRVELLETLLAEAIEGRPPGEG